MCNFQKNATAYKAFYRVRLSLKAFERDLQMFPFKKNLGEFSPGSKELYQNRTHFMEKKKKESHSTSF